MFGRNVNRKNKGKRRSWTLTTKDGITTVCTRDRELLIAGLFFFLLGAANFVFSLIEPSTHTPVFGIHLPEWCIAPLSFLMPVGGLVAIMSAYRQVAFNPKENGIRLYCLLRQWPGKSYKFSSFDAVKVAAKSEVRGFASHETPIFVVLLDGPKGQLVVVEVRASEGLVELAETLATEMGLKVHVATASDDFDIYDPWERQHQQRLSNDVVLERTQTDSGRFTSSSTLLPDPPENSLTVWEEVRGVSALRFPRHGWPAVKDQVIFWCCVGPAFLLMMVVIPLSLKNDKVEGLDLGPRTIVLLITLVLGLPILLLVMKIRTWDRLVFKDDQLVVEHHYGLITEKRRFDYADLEIVTSNIEPPSGLENAPKVHKGRVELYDRDGHDMVGRSISYEEATWIAEVISILADHHSRTS